MYLKEAEGLGWSDTKLEKARQAIGRCYKLIYNAHPGITVQEIEASHIDELKEMLDDRHEILIKSYIYFFASFINFVSKRVVYRNHEVRADSLDVKIRNKADQCRFGADVYDYILHKIATGCRPSTAYGYTHSLTQILNTMEMYSPGYRLEDITLEMLTYVRNKYTNVKESTVKDRFIILSGFLKYMLGESPMARMSFLWNRTEKRRMFIEQSDWVKLWASANEEERAILALTCGMGLRRMEVANILMGDLKDGVLKIRGKGHGPEGKVIHRKVPEPVMRAIEDYMVVRTRILGVHGDLSEGHLMIRTGTEAALPMNPNNVSAILDRLAKRAGVEMTTHSLRRMYAMTLYENGVDLAVIKDMMRHDDVNVTLQCYIMANPKKRDEAQEKVNQALFSV